ncbi:MAG: hypothetical protein J6T57_01780 [Alphaproteobacteria bacterium]|nr:hypothetical protein [Alphaproteobacteria bacterium]
MNVQKFITELLDGISRMYDGARSPELSDAYRARVDFVMWLRDSDAPDNLKQDIKTVIDKTLLREDMPEIERQIYNILSNYGIDVNGCDDVETEQELFSIGKDGTIRRGSDVVWNNVSHNESGGHNIPSEFRKVRGNWMFCPVVDEKKIEERRSLTIGGLSDAMALLRNKRDDDAIDLTTLRDSGNQKQ